ncbi:hypothetical protein VB779_08395 [Haloarculaceae archaeon H-GB11]|nr:hypothetical protein [Haloarculaceae archaeon H-GB11]
MSPHITSTVVALKTITLVLGGLITYFSYKAYARSHAEPLKYLAIGFGVVTLGALLAGVVDQMLVLDQTAALLIESSTTTIGFAVIVYSLYTE